MTLAKQIFTYNFVMKKYIYVHILLYGDVILFLKTLNFWTF